VTDLHAELWRRHPGLVWSNPEASDTVRIRAALLHPRFAEILDIAVTLGIDRVEGEWSLLVAEGGEEARRAAAIVDRILTNIRRRAQGAASGD
jgi:hypothetical protein